MVERKAGAGSPGHRLHAGKARLAITSWAHEAGTGGSPHHVFLLTRNVPTAGDDGTPRVLDEGAHNEVRPERLADKNGQENGQRANRLAEMRPGVETRQGGGVGTEAGSRESVGRAHLLAAQCSAAWRGAVERATPSGLRLMLRQGGSCPLPAGHPQAGRRRAGLRAGRRSRWGRAVGSMTSVSSP